MFHVTTKVASTLLIGVAAAAVSTALPLRTANGADSCLTEPKGDTQGKHWYYHIERGTGRHCWYLRGEDNNKSARTEDDKLAVSDNEAPSENVDAAAARSFADAHAEIAPKVAKPDSTNAAAAPSVWPASPAANAAPANNATAANSAPAEAAPDSSVASRWPQASDAAAASPSPQPDATLMTADAQDNTATANPSEPPPVASPPQRQIGSIQKLAMVAFGALTLAGLTGSAVYRFGRRRRRNDWLRERNAWQDAQNPNRPPWVDEPRLHSNHAVTDLDDRLPIEPESEFSVAMSEAEPGSDRVENIEEFLARLTQQLHEELEGSRPHNAA